ncbi:MAG: ankyrin repeat domain-containing protein [Holosporales bacterium]|jgi:ankyrin repeat protein|nr:ankyrin repeat domain-containing protein [Holosporales bacterium]
MKRFYKTMALVSLLGLGISNFSYGTFYFAEEMEQEMTQPKGVFRNSLEVCKRGIVSLWRWCWGNNAAPVLTKEDVYQYFTAIDEGRYKYAKELFSKKKDAKDSHGNTLLHRAAYRENIVAVKILLAAGAKIDNCGHTPLHEAVSTNRHTEVVKVLLAAGADKDTSYGGWTLLHFAARLGRTEIVKVLLAAGANKTLKNTNGDTPRDLAWSPSIKKLLA